MSEALHDPRRYVLATRVALASIDRRYAGVTPDECAFALGFPRIWAAARGDRPFDEAERRMLDGSARVSRTLSVAQILARCADARAPLDAGSGAERGSGLVDEIVADIRATIEYLLTGKPARLAFFEGTVDTVTSRIIGARDRDSFLRRILRIESRSRVRSRHRWNVLDVLTSAGAELQYIPGVSSAVAIVWPIRDCIRLAMKLARAYWLVPEHSPTDETVLAIAALQLAELAAILRQEPDAVTLPWIDDLRDMKPHAPPDGPAHMVLTSRAIELRGRALGRVVAHTAGAVLLKAGPFW
jgi:hypothetical protein